MKTNVDKRYSNRNSIADIDVIKIGSFNIPLLSSLGYIITFSLLLLVFTTDVQSNDVKVEASVTPRHIQLNERATLELKISGNTLMKHIGAPSFNFLPNFLAVPLRSKTTPYLVDNRLTVSMAWVYELIPQKTGQVALSDVRFSYQGVPYNANPGIITVGSVDRYIDTATDGIHKVEATVSNSKPYLNQAIEYQFRYLYTTILPTRESPSYVLPTFSDFLVEEPSDNTTTTTRTHGRTYHVDEYVRRLYPRKTGKILIPPAQLKLPIKGNPKILKTKSVALNVQPLPEIGKPANFDGAIGEYSISTSVDRRRLEVRNALTLSVTVTGTGTGTGNINTVTAPKITPMSGFRTDSPILAQRNSANTRIYEYAIIPLKSGILQLPGIEFSYFNPTKETYQTSKTGPISLTVTPNSNGTADMESDSLQWVLWLLLGIPVLALAVGGYLIYRSKTKQGNNKSPSDPPVDPSVQAMSSLQSLETNETAIDASSFVESLTGIIHRYLCDRQEMALQQLTPQEIQDMCQQIGISETDQKELLDIVTKCNYHRFAPVPLTGEERASLISRVETVINNIYRDHPT
ncbi:protein BatD [Candidatus Poribacteria bacterium]|nr:protein BatD [Candidatus Poribacteria bacterium]MYF55188.1 protein BatD [Candidatus Poribacteria bacterium]MYI93877.1 protein BatD [Candidatus Poribacteria bacterium]